MKRQKLVRSSIVAVIILFTVGCDQLSKHIVRQKVEYGTQISVIGDCVTLTKVENTGAFLGLGNSIPRPLYRLLMIIMPLAVIGYALFYLIKKETLSGLMLVAISLIMGGGLGNIYDRILYGSVTDFLYFDFVLFHTGIVNMADIFVTAGFFMILYGFCMDQRKTLREHNR
ncbi:MAG: signal peptidase II [Tannerella sp.]|jgi:signal peptidase II|nr:signal peptidase II [Tannerella sp.]